MANQEAKYIDLCSGIGGFGIALDKLNIKLITYTQLKSCFFGRFFCLFGGLKRNFK